KDPESLPPVAGRPWRRSLGHRERLAHTAKLIVRRQGDRFLGTRFHPHHVPADSNLAHEGDSEDLRAHVGLRASLRVRRVCGRHRLLHARAETWQSNGRKRDPEYPAGHFDYRRVSAFW